MPIGPVLCSAKGVLDRCYALSCGTHKSTRIGRIVAPKAVVLVSLATRPRRRELYILVVVQSIWSKTLEYAKCFILLPSVNGCTRVSLLLAPNQA